MMAARLSRIVPLLIVLAVIAAIVYLVAAYRYSPNRAKEILIKGFSWLTGGLSGFFLLATAYAWFEQNEAVFDVAGSFLIASLVALAITRICHLVFVHNHPNYRMKPVKTKTPDDRFPRWRP